MSVLPPYVRCQLATKTARRIARRDSAENVWTEAEAEKQVTEEQTAQLRAMRADARERDFLTAHQPRLRAAPRGSWGRTPC